MQGVGFRWFVREAARRLELPGWVRNEPDGSVCLEVAGAPAVLAELENEVRAGPPGAFVAMLTHETPSAAVWELPTPFAVLR